MRSREVLAPPPGRPRPPPATPPRPPHLVGDVPEGEVGEGHASISAEGEVERVPCRLVHLVVHLQQVRYGLQPTCGDTGAGAAVVRRGSPAHCGAPRTTHLPSSWPQMLSAPSHPTPALPGPPPQPGSQGCLPAPGPLHGCSLCLECSPLLFAQVPGSTPSSSHLLREAPQHPTREFPPDY